MRRHSGTTRFFAVLVLTISLTATGTFAGIVSGDFREELSLPALNGPDSRDFEVLGAVIGVGAELTSADEIANPAGYGGMATMDLDAAGLITLTGDQEGGSFADYQLAVFTLTNLAFLPSEIITGVTLISDGIVDPGGATSGTYTLTTAFTGDSVTITYTADGPFDEFDFGDGLTSTFQIETGVVPEPSSFALLGLGGLALVGAARRRRKRNAAKA